MNILLLLILVFLPEDTSQIQFIKTFSTNLPEDDEIIDPHFMDFSPSGDLYLVERGQTRVLHWSEDGKFKGIIGRKGKGPGEFESPQLIHATTDEVWVWDRSNGFMVFKPDGSFVKRVAAPPERIRRFAVVNDKLLLAAIQIRGPRGMDMEFHLLDHQGKTVKVLKSIKNSMFLEAPKGDDNVHIKAFGPEADIHSDKAGTIWFGFSEEKTIYKLNDQGEIVEKMHLGLPTAPPIDSDIEAVRRMRFTGDRGKVFTLKSMRDVKWNFDHNKAYYTHLLIRGNKVMAVLTPVSGNDQTKGYHEASYTVEAFESDSKPLFRGRYQFPEDSQILYNNGRMLAVYLNQDDVFEVKEFTIKGL